MKHTTQPLLTLLAFVLLCFEANAQFHTPQFTVGGGATANLGFAHAKQPGYAVRLWGETELKSEENYTLWIALEHVRINSVADEQKQYDPTDPRPVTYHYYPSSLTTLTLGSRRYMIDDFVLGAGGGIALISQGLNHITFPDPLLNYEESITQKNSVGIGMVLHLAYKPNAFQIALNANTGWIPFRTIDVSDKDDMALSSFVNVFGLSVGLTF